jgi:Immunity protein 53
METALIDELGWVMRWYAAKCNSDWEHSYGVTIETLDNPGWRVSLDFYGTGVEGQSFKEVSFNVEASGEGAHAHWHDYRVQDRKSIRADGRRCPAARPFTAPRCCVTS